MKKRKQSKRWRTKSTSQYNIKKIYCTNNREFLSQFFYKKPTENEEGKSFENIRGSGKSRERSLDIAEVIYEKSFFVNEPFKPSGLFDKEIITIAKEFHVSTKSINHIIRRLIGAGVIAEHKSMRCYIPSETYCTISDNRSGFQKNKLLKRHVLIEDQKTKEANILRPPIMV